MSTWFLLLGVSLAIGLTSRRWLFMPFVPVICLLLGAAAVAGEPAEYDMPGFGFVVGAIFAGLSIAAWVLGRGLAIGVRTGTRWRVRQRG